MVPIITICIEIGFIIFMILLYICLPTSTSEKEEKINNDDDISKDDESYFVTEDKEDRKIEVQETHKFYKSLEKEIPEIQDYIAMCKPAKVFPKGRCIFCGRSTNNYGCNPEDFGLHYFVDWNEFECCSNCNELITSTNRILSDILKTDNENARLNYFARLENHISHVKKQLLEDYKRKGWDI